MLYNPLHLLQVVKVVTRDELYDVVDSLSAALCVLSTSTAASASGVSNSRNVIYGRSGADSLFGGAGSDTDLVSLIVAGGVEEMS